jgi:hypothetical protein
MLQEVGRQDELLLIPISLQLSRSCVLPDILLVGGLDGVESDQVTLLLLLVQPVLERIPGDFSCNPLWSRGRNVN